MQFRFCNVAHRDGVGGAGGGRDAAPTAARAHAGQPAIYDALWRTHTGKTGRWASEMSFHEALLAVFGSSRVFLESVADIHGRVPGINGSVPGIHGRVPGLFGWVPGILGSVTEVFGRMKDVYGRAKEHQSALKERDGAPA